MGQPPQPVHTNGEIGVRTGLTYLTFVHDKAPFAVPTDANTVDSGANGSAADRTYADAHADNSGTLSDAHRGA